MRESLSSLDWHRLLVSEHVLTKDKGRSRGWSGTPKRVLQQRATLPAQVKYLVVDGAYAKRSYLDAVVTATQHVITKLRCEAACYFLHAAPRVPGQRGRTRKYDGKVNFQDLSRFTCLGTLADEEHVTLYTAVVWHKSLGRKLRLVVLVNRKEPHKPRYIVLATTAVELDARTVVRYYQARFQIEFLFRDAKQFTSLNDCQMRDEKALDFHCKASLATLNLVRVTEVQAAGTAALPVFSVASWKQGHFNERLVEIIMRKSGLTAPLPPDFWLQYFSCKFQHFFTELLSNHGLYCPLQHFFVPILRLWIIFYGGYLSLRIQFIILFL